MFSCLVLGYYSWVFSSQICEMERRGERSESTSGISQICEGRTEGTLFMMLESRQGGHWEPGSLGCFLGAR